MSIQFQVTAQPGDKLEDICQQMVIIAMHLSIIVECKFNGVLLVADPATTPKYLVEFYYKRVSNAKV